MSSFCINTFFYIGIICSYWPWHSSMFVDLRHKLKGRNLEKWEGVLNNSMAFALDVCFCLRCNSAAAVCGYLCVKLIFQIDTPNINLVYKCLMVCGFYLRHVSFVLDLNFMVQLLPILHDFSIKMSNKTITFIML